MKRNTVALVARADKSRTHIAQYLRDGGYDVFETADLAIGGQFAGVVLIDDAGASNSTMTRVQAWLRSAKSARVVIISSKPAAWKALSLAHSDALYVLPAPAFGWDIVDALRATPPTLPNG
jgi:hypothetical protein